MNLKRQVAFRLLQTIAITVLVIFGLPLSEARGQATGTPVPEVSTALIFDAIDQGSQNYFSLDLEPGDSAKLAIRIGNGGGDPVMVRTYAADAFTLQNGGFGLLDADAEDTGVTTWLDYPDEALQLDAGKDLTREFSVTVPADTPPGQYITGVALETTEPADTGAQEGMFQFEQYFRSVRAVFVTVPGEQTPALEVGNATVQQDSAVPSVVIEVANTGNVLLNPSGTVEIRDETGTPVLTAPVQMGTVYAGHTTTLSLALTAPLPPGDYSINAALADESQDVTATLDNAPLAVAAPATPAPPPPITIASASVEPGPNADNVQFAVVDATIANTGEPIGNAQLSLLVFKDGEEVERFPISQALSLQTGDTAINTRYIPLEGWSSGEWTFELLLEQVEGSGAAVVVASQPIEGSITIP